MKSTMPFFGVLLLASFFFIGPLPFENIPAAEAQVCTPTGFCRPDQGPACCSGCKQQGEACGGGWLCVAGPCLQPDIPEHNHLVSHKLNVGWINGSSLWSRGELDGVRPSLSVGDARSVGIDCKPRDDKQE
jgi:hypothetical protein